MASLPVKHACGGSNNGPVPLSNCSILAIPTVRSSQAEVFPLFFQSVRDLLYVARRCRWCIRVNVTAARQSATTSK